MNDLELAKEEYKKAQSEFIEATKQVAYTDENRIKARDKFYYELAKSNGLIASETPLYRDGEKFIFASIDYFYDYDDFSIRVFKAKIYELCKEPFFGGHINLYTREPK